MAPLLACSNQRSQSLESRMSHQKPTILLLYAGMSWFIHAQPCCNLTLNCTHSQFGETPLHFACKLGHSEIVSLLLTFPLISTSIKNRDGKTASEIICQKSKSPLPEVKARIEELLRGKSYTIYGNTHYTLWYPNLDSPDNLIRVYC